MDTGAFFKVFEATTREFLGERNVPYNMRKLGEFLRGFPTPVARNLGSKEKHTQGKSHGKD